MAEMFAKKPKEEMIGRQDFMTIEVTGNKNGAVKWENLDGKTQDRWIAATEKHAKEAFNVENFLKSLTPEKLSMMQREYNEFKKGPFSKPGEYNNRLFEEFRENYARAVYTGRAGGNNNAAKVLDSAAESAFAELTSRKTSAITELGNGKESEGQGAKAILNRLVPKPVLAFMKFEAREDVEWENLGSADRKKWTDATRKHAEKAFNLESAIAGLDPVKISAINAENLKLKEEFVKNYTKAVYSQRRAGTKDVDLILQNAGQTAFRQLNRSVSGAITDI